MKLKWTKSPDSLNTWRAESVRYRYIIVAPPRSNAALWVQPGAADWGTEPIAEQTLRTRRGAERVAQRFENRVLKAKKLV